MTGIRYWSTADYTRVAIDLDAEVKYEAGRVPDPDRIFFDLPDTRLASTLVGKSFDVEDSFLKKIRVAQYDKDSTRVVLEVDDVAEYSAFLLPNPYRLIVDIHGKNAAATQVATNKPPDGNQDEQAAKAMGSASSVAVKPNAKSASNANSGGASETLTKPEQKTAAKTAKPPSDPKPETASAASPAKSDSAPTTRAFKSASGELKAETKTESGPPATTVRATTPVDKAKTEPVSAPDTLAKVTTKPTSAPTAVTVVPEKKGNNSKKSARNNAGDVQGVHAAAPTSEGDRSLIRALGLKIGTHRD